MDRDHNRSSDSGTGAKTLDRDDFPQAAQSGSSGGDMAREVGQRDELKTAGEDPGVGQDPSVTAVRNSDKPDDGDMPNPPNRDGGGTADRAPPRRT